MIRSFDVSFTALRRAILVLAVFLVGCSSPEDKAQSYYEQGMKLLSQQDYVKAGIEFKNALQNKKDLIGAWRGLLEIEEHNKNFQGSIPILQTIVELDSKDVSSRLKLGRLSLLSGDTDRALSLAEAAIALDDRNSAALSLKAAVLFKLKDSVGALREAKTALDIDPANAEALIVLSAERLFAGDNEGALSILERPGLTYKKEDELAIQLFKLQIYEKMGDVKREEPLLRKLVDLYPSEPAFQRTLVNLYIKEKRYDDAEKELRSFAAANPSNIAAGLNIVRLLLQTKGADAARQELVTRINAGGEGVFKYQLALADFDLTQGKVTDSIQLLENLVGSARSTDDKVAAQVKLAQIQFQQKKFDAAGTLVSAILRSDSRNLDGLKLRAALRLQGGQVDTAIADLRQALDDQPRSTDLMLLLANAYERSGSIDLAEKQYADAAKGSGFDVGTTMNYVGFLRRRGNVERAEDLLTQLARQWPNNVAVLSVLADVRLARQNWAGAQEVAEAIKRLGNAQGLSNQILAAALSGQGKYGDSIKILESVQAAAPGAVQPMAALVSTLVRAQKLDEAESFLQTVLKTNPANAEAHVMLGTVQVLKNAPDKAVQNFQTASERQPKDIVGYSALAEFYARNKKLDEAEKVIRAGLHEQPDNFSLHLTLAAILEQKSDYDGAIGEYEILLKQDPGSLIVANNLASMLSDRRNDKASLDRAYSIAGVLRKTQVPSFKDTLGWIDYLRGDFKSATSLLEEAAAAMPNRPMVQYHLGMSYLANGQAEKASEQFKKALTLAPDNSLQQKIEAGQKKVAGNQ
jgi:predicted Zn-dependent protease